MLKLKGLIFRTLKNSQPEEFVTFYKEYEKYKPLLESERVPRYFQLPGYMSVAPLAGASLWCLAGVSFGWEGLGTVAYWTCTYSALHSTLLAGAHWGLASSLFDPAISSQEGKNFRLQFILYATVPMISWMTIGSLFTLTPTIPRLLNTIGMLCSLYVGIQVGDNLYATQHKTIPAWYRHWKMYITLGSISSLAVLAFLVYTHKDAFRREAKEYVTIQRDLEEDDLIEFRAPNKS